MADEPQKSIEYLKEIKMPGVGEPETEPAEPAEPSEPVEPEPTEPANP